MASPRRVRTSTPAGSIEAQAKIRAGEPVSQQDIILEEQAKLHLFKSRRNPINQPQAAQPFPKAAASPASNASSSIPIPKTTPFQTQHQTVTALGAAAPQARAVEPAPFQAPAAPVEMPSPEQSPPTTDSRPLDLELRQLKQLLDGGLITQQDFDTRKQKKLAEAIAKFRPPATPSRAAQTSDEGQTATKPEPTDQAADPPARSEAPGRT